ncbi:hypothetical protein [Neomegalonema sp.]|uniref:hypothetical protein n=1 Tax=Neomegalonema sp. TaxID=2039713 RepID=UPI002611A9A4|nr:hypothetical protein [Neomegalonema sp.]MDD2869925.1 hypothetical protein [Neomegalonema sp.]
MWAFQWTLEAAPLDEEIRAALADESQGVVDVVVKLFMLTQMRAIQLGLLEGREERISAALIRHVARTELKLIAPMIDALRRGDQRALQQYDDLRPFEDFMRQTLSDAVVRLGGRMTPPVPTPAPTSSMTDDKLIVMLEEMGLGADIAALLLAEVRADLPEAGPLDLVREIAERLKGRGLIAKPAQRKRKAAPKIAAPSPAPQEDPQDLRRLLTPETTDAYAAFREAGWTKLPADDAA